MLLLLACSSPDPAAHAQGWFELLAAGEDDQAWELLDSPSYAPGWDEEHFGLRVDRLKLRQALTITKAEVRHHEAPPSEPLDHALLRFITNLDGIGDVEGELADGRVVSLMVQRSGVVSDLTIGSTTLIPSHDYEVIPRAPPLDEPLPMTALKGSWEHRGTTPFLVVDGVADFSFGGATFLVDSRCQTADGLWMRQSTQSTRSNLDPGPNAVHLMSAQQEQSPLCEVLLEMSEQDGRRQGRYCLREGVLEQGECPERPVLRGREVVATDLTTTVDRGGASVHYTLYAPTLPEQHGDQSASITTVLACSNRRSVHRRPIDRSWLEPGEVRRFGSIYTDDLQPPCEVSLSYARWDDYFIEEKPLYTGCFDGELHPGGC